MNYIKIGLKYFSRIAFFKTLVINLKYFPIKTALKFPIVIGKGTILRSLKGTIEIGCQPRPGIVTIGVEYIFNDCKSNKSILDNKGKIVFDGKVIIHTGVSITTSQKGILHFKGDNKIGAGSLIAAHEHIEIGNKVHMSWKVQIVDTSFHYTLDTITNSIGHKTSKVVIEDSVWIGNHVLISKGTFIPSGSIVASCSMVNKSFKGLNNNVVIGGVPAKVIREGLKRIFDEEFEMNLDKQMFIEQNISSNN